MPAEAKGIVWWSGKFDKFVILWYNIIRKDKIGGMRCGKSYTLFLKLPKMQTIRKNA